MSPPGRHILPGMGRWQRTALTEGAAAVVHPFERNTKPKTPSTTFQGRIGT